MTGLPKYDQLRLKTDIQLIRLIQHELDLGTRHARLALIAAGGQAPVAEHHDRAKSAYANALRLIGLAGVIQDEQNRQWEGKLQQLREMLDGLSVLESSSGRDRVPTLARALWKARDCPEGSPEEDWYRAERALKSRPVCAAR